MLLGGLCRRHLGPHLVKYVGFLAPLPPPRRHLLPQSLAPPSRAVNYPNNIIIGAAAAAAAQTGEVSDLGFPAGTVPKPRSGAVRDLISNSDRSRGRVTHRSHVFSDIYQLPAYTEVTDPAKQSREIDNAGGGSDVSEMYSIDYLMRIHDASEIIFETQVQYWITYKMVDYICTIDQQRVGVSVARAMEERHPVRVPRPEPDLSHGESSAVAPAHPRKQSKRRRRRHPSPDYFGPEAAAYLLYKKLYGLIVARNAVSDHQSFYRSILHIWCQNQRIADLMQEAFANLDDNDYGLDVKGVVILQLTVCPDIQLYRNRVI